MTGQIYFNQKEVDYISDCDFLLTKRKITEKVFDLLACVQEAIIPLLQQYRSIIPGEVLSVSGKISKGENYGSLPYLILDCPRFFNKKDIFAIRTMFWWGNYCSITLHLQGALLEKYRRKLIENASGMKSGNYYICINKTPWEYHFDQHNYLPVTSLSLEDLQAIIKNKEFVKISSRIDFEQMPSLDQKAVGFVNDVIGFLK